MSAFRDILMARTMFLSRRPRPGVLLPNHQIRINFSLNPFFRRFSGGFLSTPSSGRHGNASSSFLHFHMIQYSSDSYCLFLLCRAFAARLLPKGRVKAPQPSVYWKTAAPAVAFGPALTQTTPESQHTHGRGVSRHAYCPLFAPFSWRGQCSWRGGQGPGFFFQSPKSALIFH